MRLPNTARVLKKKAAVDSDLRCRGLYSEGNDAAG